MLQVKTSKANCCLQPLLEGYLADCMAEQLRESRRALVCFKLSAWRPSEKSSPCTCPTSELNVERLTVSVTFQNQQSDNPAHFQAQTSHMQWFTLHTIGFGQIFVYSTSMNTFKKRWPERVPLYSRFYGCTETAKTVFLDKTGRQLDRAWRRWWQQLFHLNFNFGRRRNLNLNSYSVFYKYNIVAPLTLLS